MFSSCILASWDLEPAYTPIRVLFLSSVYAKEIVIQTYESICVTDASVSHGTVGVKYCGYRNISIFHIPVNLGC